MGINLDISVLENYHLAEAFKLLSKKDYDIFSDLTTDEFKFMRKRIVGLVLATDMSLHTKQYSYLKMKAESYSIKDGSNVTDILEGLDQSRVIEAQQEILNILLHNADISNPTKIFKIYEKWVDKVMNEFWRQGDKEKELKLPISFLCDRTTVNPCVAQIGFIDGIVFPLLCTVCEFFPGLNFLKQNCIHNREIYVKMKEQEENMENTIKMIS